ncbi:MAG: mechanosensitive ion channel family protein, partial [Planctomycetota bacterium]
LVLLISYFVARLVAAVVNWLLERRLKLSRLAEDLISRTIKNLILIVGFAIALTALEVDITPIIAAIGAAGFIVGFALQGTLSNFASGLMILVNKPFDVGDVVTAGGVTGAIHGMNIVSTTFRTFDNQTIHVPNNEIWGNVITNITANDQRRVDMEFGIGYDDDLEQAERIIREVVEENELVLDDPEPMIAMHELGDSTVNIVCRPWAKTSDWWSVKTQVTRRVKQRFDEAGISIPFPQRDVHVYQHSENAVV